MKIAIIYKSVTGNTKLLAEEIQKNLNNEIIYIGAPQENIDADLYFIGSWTFKGDCVKEIADYLKTIHNKKIAYFGTCGFGGSISYYETIFKRVESNIDESNELLGYFICQGKMPLTVKQKYKFKNATTSTQNSGLVCKNAAINFSFFTATAIRVAIRYIIQLHRTNGTLNPIHT